MNKEQAVFEQLTLRDFKKWNSQAFPVQKAACNSCVCNFTFNTTNQCFWTLLPVILRFIKKGSHE